MSQRAEKYARHMEQRAESLEQRADKLEGSQEKIVVDLVKNGCRIKEIERTIHALYENEVDARHQREASTARAANRYRREIERTMARQRVALVIAVVLAAADMIVAVMAMGVKQMAYAETASAVEGTETAVELLVTEPEVIEAWEFAATYQNAEDPLEAEKIEEALLAQGYFSVAVPMCYEYQDYMRTYCAAYDCPYPLALAVAEVESNFNMEAVGANGEIGIMQLYPGPDGAYLQALQEATGIDPTTPSGNIAAGCYLLGKHLEEYGDATKAAMAYNMGRAGAKNAWAAGITSTDYSNAVLDAMEGWECTVNAWAGE